MTRRRLSFHYEQPLKKRPLTQYRDNWPFLLSVVTGRGLVQNVPTPVVEPVKADDRGAVKTARAVWYRNRWAEIAAKKKAEK